MLEETTDPAVARPVPPTDRVGAGPLPAVPAPAPGAPAAYDTGSDAWLRAQAALSTTRSGPLPTAAPSPDAPGAALLPTQRPAPTASVPTASVPTASVPVGRAALPRGRHASQVSRSPLRALAGAGLAVAGVLLVVGALLLATGDPSASNPTVGPAPAGQPAAGFPLGSPDATPTPPGPGPAAVASAPEPAPVSTPSPLPTVGAPAAPLTVLNNSRIPGLANRAAAQLQAGGWVIAQISYFTGRIVSSTVYFDQGQEPAARHLAAQFPFLHRVLPRFAGLPGSGLTVVVTRDFSS